MSKPKLMILGHARHGKDTVCELLRDYHGYKFISSSEAALEAVIWPSLRHTYKDRTECFDDRANHRALWFQLIAFHNSVDPSRLARDVYSQADIYCGIRARREFETAKAQGLFDYSLWVDASRRILPEPDSSMQLSVSDADFVISNNYGLSELEEEVSSIAATLIGLDIRTDS